MITFNDITHRPGMLFENGTVEIRETPRHFMKHMVCHTMVNLMFPLETEQ